MVCLLAYGDLAARYHERVARERGPCSRSVDASAVDELAQVRLE
jgi:hypothetical protein